MIEAAFASGNHRPTIWSEIVAARGVLAAAVTKSPRVASNGLGNQVFGRIEQQKMGQHHFNVFGQLVVIKGAPGHWTAFLLCPDGKRRQADFVVPAALAEDELCRYLSDLFHERASSTQRCVTRIG